MADNQLLGFLDKSREVAVVLGLDMEKRQIEGRQEIEISGRKEIGPGSLDPSQLTLVNWLGEVRELFPRETVETIEKHKEEEIMKI